MPKDAWQRPSPVQHRATDARKREGSRTGKQFATNTGSGRDEGSARARPAAHDTDPLPFEMDSLAHRYVGVNPADGRVGVAGPVLTTADGHLYDLQAARGEPT